MPEHDGAKLVEDRLVAVSRKRIDGELHPTRPALQIPIHLVERYLSHAEFAFGRSTS